MLEHGPNFFTKYGDTRKKISSRSRLRPYVDLVLSVVLYHAGTWGVNDKVICKINIFHGGHLRNILGLRLLKVTLSEEMYKRCDSKPLNETVKRFRWQLFGHCLRML